MSGAVCQKEVERFHVFLSDWMNGMVENKPEIFEEECTGQLTDDFCMVNAMGLLLSKTQFITNLQQAYHSTTATASQSTSTTAMQVDNVSTTASTSTSSTNANKVEYRVQNCHVLQNLTKEFKLVSFEQWKHQANNNETTAKRCTAILKLSGSSEVQWKYIHETWLNGKGPPPPASPTKSTTTSPLHQKSPTTNNLTLPLSPQAMETSALMTTSPSSRLVPTNTAPIHHHHPSSKSLSRRPLVAKKQVATTSTTANQPLVLSLTSSRRHLSPQLPLYGATPIFSKQQTELTGMSFFGIHLQTTQGPMASSTHWLDPITARLERLAQYKIKSKKKNDEDEKNEENQKDGEKEEKQGVRKIILPEICYNQAAVILTIPPKKQSLTSVQLQWTAFDALEQWATAHESIPLGTSLSAAKAMQIAVAASSKSKTDEKDDKEKDDDKDDEDEDKKEKDADKEGEDVDKSLIYTGVAVLDGVDADLWKHKRNDQMILDASSNAMTSRFHHDWTFSTPFSVKATCHQHNHLAVAAVAPALDSILVAPNTTINAENTKVPWKRLEKSGMNLALLQDMQQPILYYDEIFLFEDDLHDNGFCQLKVKLRVMPTCMYILARLYCRLDQLLVRVRDTRLQVEFILDKEKDGESKDEQHKKRPYTEPRALVIYRDVTWRECLWSDLAKHKLPTHVASWKTPEEQEQQQQQQQQAQQAQAQAQSASSLEAFIQRLPTVSLPPTLDAHSQLDLPKEEDDDNDTSMTM